MLFLVISTPGPTKPSMMRDNRERYWEWLAPMIESGTVRHNYARVGRGAIAVLDVDSSEQLHTILNEWCELIPTKFDVHPLLDPAAAQNYLTATAS